MGPRNGFRRNRGVHPVDNSLESQEHPGAASSTTPSVQRRRGRCKSGACGREAACKQDSRNGVDFYSCICPHDDSPPKGPDMRCPNRSTVPHTPSPIHNIIPPTTNISLGGSPSPASPSPPMTRAPPLLSPSDMALAGVAVFVVAVLCAVCLVCLVRRRSVRARKKQAPRSLTKGPLGSDHFLPNPQYSVQQTGLHAGLLGLGAGDHPVDMLPRRSLTLLQAIGEGCFGKVYKGELIEEHGDMVTVAVKVLKENATKEAEEDFMREVEVMSSFRHPHILTLIGVVPRDATAAPCMVFEFMPYGDLTEVLRSSSKNIWEPPRPGLPPLTQEALIGIALQIALGMRYLAAQRFVHRDLACRNCLVGRDLTVKIADFGMSRDVYTCDYYKIGGSRLLPVRWMSPEALLYGRFTLESDVWSYGVVLWEVLTRGKQPYYGHANEEVVKLILQGVLLQPPEDCPPVAVELMRCCWKSEPRDRQRFPEICASLEAALLGPGAHPRILPRPPAFPLPDDLDGLAMPESEELLDNDNYLLPRIPSPTRCQYMQPLPD